MSKFRLFSGFVYELVEKYYGLFSKHNAKQAGKMLERSYRVVPIAQGHALYGIKGRR